jgi:hypothetical protein
MATNFSMGHGMRRRSGVPSSYTEAAGKSMARAHNTSDENYNEAAAANSVRIPIGAAQVEPSLRGTLVPKKNTKAADPTNPGSKANRANIERAGATYRIQPKTGYSVVDPTVGPTMANARIVPSVAGRATPNFQGGSSDGY